MKEKYQDLIIFYSNKNDGNMSKKYGNDADLNRRRFIQKMGISLNRFLLMQSDNQDLIIELKEEVLMCEDLYYKLIEADAIVCKVPNVYLYLNFADCIPFVIYDKKQRIFAFAHLGWRSTYLNLHQKLFSLFIEKYESNLEDLLIYIGPSIKKESYLLENPIQKDLEVWKPYVSFVRDNLYSIDLVHYVSDFFQSKLLESQIIISSIDTGSDKDYFSHYRAIKENEREGRFFFGVGRKDE